MGDWNETKVINTGVKNGGKTRYYSTGDLYPWVQAMPGKQIHTGGPYHNATVTLEYGTPSWDVTHGSWHSMDWLQQILPAQIATGDNVWSPFVAAGWSEQEELNTRPAQWLGFLKMLTITGAEYFYSGFFSLHHPFPDSRNWIWQAAAPPLAQALTSNWLDVLYEGELLRGDMPIAPVRCAVMQPLSDPMEWVWLDGLDNWQLNTSKYEPYRFWAGSQSVAVMVRKLAEAEVYVIAGTVQPQSNFNEAPLAQDVQITLPNATHPGGPGTDVRFTVRRQGSMYILNNTADLKRPVMRQVDSWHEATHLLRWSSDFACEAELHDDHARADPANLHTELAANAQHERDFVGATSYTALGDGDALRFTVTPRPMRVNEYGVAQGPVSHRRYAVKLRARSTEPGAAISVSGPDGAEIGVVAAEGRAFTWAAAAQSNSVADEEGAESAVSIVSLPTGVSSTLTVTASGGLDIDSLRLVEQP